MVTRPRGGMGPRVEWGGEGRVYGGASGGGGKYPTPSRGRPFEAQFGGGTLNLIGGGVGYLSIWYKDRRPFVLGNYRRHLYLFTDYRFVLSGKTALQTISVEKM